MKKWLFSAAAVLVPVLLIICWLPFFAEQVLLPRFLTKNGLEGYRVDIQRLGLDGSSIRLSGQPDSFPVVSSGFVRIEWTLTGLLHRRLHSLTLEGLHVHHYSTGPEDTSGSQKSPKTPQMEQDLAGTSPGPFRVPVVIDAVRIADGVFFLHENGALRSLPFSLSGQIDTEPMPAEEGIIGYRVKGDIGEHGYDGSISYSPAQGVLSADLKGRVNLPMLAGELNRLESAGTIAGRADLSVEADVHLTPLVLVRMEARVRTTDFQWQNKKLALKADQDAGAFLALSSAGDSFQINGAGFAISRPLNTTLSFESQGVFSEDYSLWWQGAVTVDSLSGQQLGNSLMVEKAPAVTFNLKGTAGDRKIDIHVSATTGKKTQQEVFAVSYNQLALGAEQLDLDAQCAWQYGSQQKPFIVSVGASGENLTLSGPGMHSGLAVFKLEGTGSLDAVSGQHMFEVDGGLLVDNGFLQLDEPAVYVEDVSLRLPLAFPWKDSGTRGEFRAERISLRQANLGKVSGVLIPRSSALEFAGRFSTPLLADDSLSIKGTFRLPENRVPVTEFSCSLAKARADLADFASIFPALENVTGGGLLDIQADMIFQRQNTAGRLEIALFNWGVEAPGYKTAVQDLNMQLLYPDLPRLRSAPEQELSIGRITSSKVSVEELRAVFQVEPGSGFFVEKIGGKWGGGRIFTSAFRLNPDRPEFDAALFCDRLELSQILSQLGLADAEGSGKVSGRIPLSYRNREVFIDDGFLYSTPGETGYLKIKKSRQLTAGIPEDVPQYSPIHFAGAALRDFEYNWAKLLLVSEGDNLALKLQVDGKPARPLPYRFDSGKNVFVRMDDSESGGIDQPVKLDINFNIPLNELLRHQATILPILRSIK